MKRILLISMSAELGGIEKSLINFLKYLGTCDCKVDLMLWKKRGELLSAIPECVNIIDSPAPGDIKKIFRERCIKKTIQYIKLKYYTKKGIPWRSFPQLKQRYDIAIAYSQDGYSPYYIIDNVNAEKKFLWYHHGTYMQNRTEKERDLKYYSHFNKVVTVSQANLKMLCNEFPQIKDKFMVIPNLLDEINITEKACEKNEVFSGFTGCKIVTVGRISPEKGQLKCLETAKWLNEQGFDFRWYFIGDGPDKSKCEETVREMQLEKKCVFVGAKKNPYSYIAVADLYVQLSFVEADPISIQEALILKKIIVASDIPPIKEALKDGKLGKLCCITPKKAGECIISIYNDSKEKEKILKEIERSERRNIMCENELNKLLFI